MEKGFDIGLVFPRMWTGRTCSCGEIICNSGNSYEIGPSHDYALVASACIPAGFYFRYYNYQLGWKNIGENYQMGIARVVEQTRWHSVIRSSIFVYIQRHPVLWN